MTKKAGSRHIQNAGTDDFNENLVIGRLPFLICAPYFFKSLKGMPNVQFVDGTPARLNLALQYGEVDCAPCSSIEYARNHQEYWIVPGFSTGGQSRIKSVVFLSHIPWEQISRKNIFLSSESATSNILFQILCQRRYKVDPIFNLPEEPAGRVAIGNEALSLAYNSNWRYCYDLAEEWYKWQGLPFCFGLWLARHAVFQSKKKALKGFIGHLRESRDSFFKDLGKSLKKWTVRYPADLPERIMISFFENIDYDLTSLHEKSLLLFFKLASDLGYSGSCTSLRFIDLEGL